MLGKSEISEMRGLSPITGYYCQLTCVQQPELWLSHVCPKLIHNLSSHRVCMTCTSPNVFCLEFWGFLWVRLLCWLFWVFLPWHDKCLTGVYECEINTSAKPTEAKTVLCQHRKASSFLPLGMNLLAAAYISTITYVAWKDLSYLGFCSYWLCCKR